MLATNHNSPCIFQEVTREFFRGSLANAWENMAEDALRKVCDVFVNLPTGFGKSVVFQALPVVYSHVEKSRETNIVIVVSPLVNLMKDQVSHLTSLGTSAVSPSDICS